MAFVMEKSLTDTETVAQPAIPSWRSFLSGMYHMLPLCLSVIPWGILAGSVAVQSGLTLGQSIGMSAILFAGAAQLVTLGLLASGASVFTIIISVFFITAQHFLYGLTLREYVAILKARYRLPIGFLLTDELFALSCAQQNKSSLTPSYLIGAGLCFYLCWNLFSLLGIVMASTIPDLAKYHLDFSIVATFITIVIPMIKKISIFCGVCFSLTLSMLLSYLHVEGAIIIAGVSGMFFSVLIAKLAKEST
ncbi:AzlC family protein [Xenorhabdus bovienii str. puntauvense]|uniref:Predicted branched-chain amino acid permease (Azaleucine resistance) n=3 Tax=Xenorhabdus bovienii TaxID=40576 RepID=A0A0B6X6T2_XENBV|nr:AzlC family protein [Xenorhabdus bovienii str. feltiae France]CDG92865.1 AzlC family protein [Xenorhabdus bovienii str. feltiae Florida]CDG98974.1 AzlC family protein [Xenorhabdus bovienii str. puntauvense]CDM88413.1 Predicted branched-chain amino acid permease (azaleucine resistance) [Xenorhabdus bovienii]